MRTLIYEGIWGEGVYSSVELTSISWQRRYFLVEEILIKSIHSSASIILAI